jgi:hypothetical protein
MPLTNVPPAVLDAWLAGRVGYGRLAARYWFIGLEERCTDPHGEIRLRLQGGLLEDSGEAHELAPGSRNIVFLATSTPS